MKLNEISTGEAAIAFGEYLDDVKKYAPRLTKNTITNIQAAFAHLLKNGFEYAERGGGDQLMKKGVVHVIFPMAGARPQDQHLRVRVYNADAGVDEAHVDVQNVHTIDWSAAQEAFIMRGDAFRASEAATAAVDKVFPDGRP